MIKLKSYKISNKETGYEITLNPLQASVTENDIYIFVTIEMDYKQTGMKFTQITQFSKENFTLEYEMESEDG